MSAIERIEKYLAFNNKTSPIDCTFSDGERYAYERVLKILKEEQSKSSWIPVEERLPEVGVYVLCCCEDNPMKVCKRHRELIDDPTQWIDGVGYWANRITHWQPLPPAPGESR